MKLYEALEQAQEAQAQLVGYLDDQLSVIVTAKPIRNTIQASLTWLVETHERPYHTTVNIKSPSTDRYANQIINWQPHEPASP